MAEEELQELSYHGSEDITLWLQRVNGDHDPVVLPYTPAAGYAAVSLEWLGEPQQPPYKLGTVYEKTAVFSHRLPGRLWFCNVPLSELDAATSADVSRYN